MIGDGVSDLETQSVVDTFIGYLGYAAREKVQEEAKNTTYILSEILDILI
jgi:phosphoserine phosphatase